MAKMQITPELNLKLPSFPLPIYESIKIADAVSRDGEKFSILVGLDKKLVEQLEKYSADENDIPLQKFSKDKKRFVEGKYEDWYKKNRTPFALLRDATNTLVALIWLGPEPLHEGCKCHTISWRSYNPWRGKGLMRDFTKFAMGIYKKNFPDVKYWARIVRTNEGSLNFAESLGFEISKKFSDDSSLVLTTFAQS